MYQFVTSLLMGAALLAPALAQEQNMMAKFADHWRTQKKYVIALAEQMPAEDYGFKPNPEEMSFGRQMAHIATANAFFFSKISGKPNPIAQPANYDKATVLKLLSDSFDFCINAMEGITPEQLHATIKTPDGEMTGAEALLFVTDHNAHHRGQAIVYLRAKNIKPAEYEF
jgi:uncharacterized damage-inducible protein DinB